MHNGFRGKTKKRQKKEDMFQQLPPRLVLGFMVTLETANIQVITHMYQIRDHLYMAQIDTGSNKQELIMNINPQHHGFCLNNANINPLEH